MATRVDARVGGLPAAGGRLAAAATIARRGLGAAAFLGIATLIGLALASHDPADPSLSVATAATPRNWLGGSGALFADLVLQAVGLAAWLVMPALLVAAWRAGRGERQARGWRGAAATLLALPLAGGALGAAWTVPVAALPAGVGGLPGLLAEAGANALAATATLDGLPVAAVLAALFGAIALTLLTWGSGLRAADLLGAARLLRRRTPAPEPYVAPPPRRAEPLADGFDAGRSPAPTVVIEPPAAPPPGKRQSKERQASLDLRDHYQLPGLDLLAPPPKGEKRVIDRAALEQNGRLLQTVLEDFGVKGRIGEIRPGPVVTMYELEPAPGLKASRVIGLSDDIARSMSALSARVAVVPGRNVIGIELPNARREMVLLSELVGSAAFDDRSRGLPLVLGKNIAGDPVIADLSPMPHLLIAGTTGSGKSVGLNCMILSLLYRLPPDQCRMIMIDPKMLELSVYDGIPHLLSPVVTDPPKAIRALKWAVEEMEDRYRKMATINVRSVAGFNARVREAKASGKPFERRVHVGYDEADQPIHEVEKLEFEPLPLIVVVVDELADLMMTAGKEVEFLIQRLAQKARAAGIHLIMATQRPSVDVITGVIKANLPTRISFAVTSKIDSRTILGEQGAEQLLGKGDMLYMPGGKQVVRIHGPFVGDEEVERVADHWRGQGRPDYLDAVTQDPPDGGGDDDPGLALAFGGTTGDNEDDLYRRAVQVVAESRKASVSYVQRQLRVGYNSAARLIEKMEKAGVVGPPDHVGRREVLVDESGR